MLATAIAIAAFAFGTYFAATDLCLDAGGRAVGHGFGCEDAAGNRAWPAVPGGVVVFAALSAAGVGAGAYRILRSRRRRSAR